METFSEYYDNGALKARGFKDGKGMQEKWVYYYESGALWKEVFFKDDLKHGVAIFWHENGNLYIESHNEKGKTLGSWKEYYENGKIKEIGEYKEEGYFPIDFWDESGNQLLIGGTGKKIEKFGHLELDIYEHFFENGKFVKEVKVSSARYESFIPDEDAEQK